jgi:hypothetical protein
VHCGPEVEIGGEETPSVYRSSDWAERGFCPACGTHLFYHLLPSDEYILPAGLFQTGSQFRLTSQVFIDEKPEYYEFANETLTMTGEQVFAAFSGSQD